MTASDPPGGNAAAGAVAQFVGRAPSQTWEPIPLPGEPSLFVWAWFKPQGMPNALALRIPDEAWQVQPQPVQWTMRRLLQGELTVTTEINCAVA